MPLARPTAAGAVDVGGEEDFCVEGVPTGGHKPITAKRRCIFGISNKKEGQQPELCLPYYPLMSGSNHLLLALTFVHTFDCVRSASCDLP